MGELHARLLAALEVSQPRNTDQLAEALGLPREAVGAACRELERAGKMRQVGRAIGHGKSWKLRTLTKEAA